MTVLIYGPDWPRIVMLDAAEPGRPPFATEAETLGQAICAYETEFGAAVAPYDGSLGGFPLDPKQPAKYFLCRTGKPTRFGDLFVADIHIVRAGETLCPKQDLSFPWKDGDLIEFVQPVC